MVYRLLIDENVEHGVLLLHRFENYGHDVEHVDFLPGLGKGIDDGSIARCSLDEERGIVTYDADFVPEVDEDDYRAVLYVGEAALPVERVEDIVHIVSQHYPQEEVDGLTYVGRSWLRSLVYDTASHRTVSRYHWLPRDPRCSEMKPTRPPPERSRRPNA